MDLNTTWFLLIGVLLVGYALLDGFDLGVGVMHLFTKSDKHRRINLNSIGPVWDGNEVWLLTGGGALFAAFPPVYASVFSGFYLAFMVLLFALIARATALEFRHQINSPRWQKIWDVTFGIGSLLPALLFGVALGNIMRGVPIDAAGHLDVAFLALLNPYSLLVGLLSLTAFTMHGAAWLNLKTDGEQQAWAQRWASGSWMLFLVIFLVILSMTFFTNQFLLTGMLTNPMAWLFLVLLMAGIILFPIWLRGRKPLPTILATGAQIAGVMGLIAVGLFPTIVPSSLNPDWSLTVYNASSTPLTLKTMLIIALIGVPIMLVYTFWIYFIFRGKTVIEDESY
jgi:cytochrome bd ubiquinol oxidase subunit II